MQTQKQIEQITRGQFYAILSGIRGAKMCTIVTHTEPVMNKFDREERKNPNPFLGAILKETRINVTLNFNYTNSVNNQRAKEGNEEEFVAEPRKWGERVAGTPFVTHTKKGQHNTEVYVEAKANGAPQSVRYFAKDNNADIPVEHLKPFMPEKSSNAEHQGVEKEIIVRDFKFNSIVEMLIDGHHYAIV